MCVRGCLPGVRISNRLLGVAGTCVHLQAWAAVHRSVSVTKMNARGRAGHQDLCGKRDVRLIHHFLPSSEMFQEEISPCKADKDTVCGCKENQFQRYLSETHFQCVPCSPCFNGTVTIPCEHHSPSSGISCPASSVSRPHEVAASLLLVLSVGLSSCVVSALLPPSGPHTAGTLS